MVLVQYWTERMSWTILCVSGNFTNYIVPTVSGRVPNIYHRIPVITTSMQEDMKFTEIPTMAGIVTILLAIAVTILK
jgi:hypothetical protein